MEHSGRRTFPVIRYMLESLSPACLLAPLWKHSPHPSAPVCGLHALPHKVGQAGQATTWYFVLRNPGLGDTIVSGLSVLPALPQKGASVSPEAQG